MTRSPEKTRIHNEIFGHLDYRSFLKDLVAALKAQRPEFTMRYFAQKAGLGSPSYLKMVIDGKRQLTDKSMDKFCEALLLNGREKEYFTALVKYNQETNPDQKAQLFEQLTHLRPRKTLTALEKNQIKYLTHHHYACIREMVLLKDFFEDAKWIAARCLPRISPQEARDALETLLDMGLLKHDTNGKLIQSESVVGTQAQTEAVEAFNFHDAVLTKARQCLSQSKQDERHFEALTSPVTPKIYKALRDKIHKLIDESLEEVNSLQEGFDDIYQLNVQLFPVTKNVAAQSSKADTEPTPSKQEQS